MGRKVVTEVSEDEGTPETEATETEATETETTGAVSLVRCKLLADLRTTVNDAPGLVPYGTIVELPAEEVARFIGLGAAELVTD